MTKRFKVGDLVEVNNRTNTKRWIGSIGVVTHAWPGSLDVQILLPKGDMITHRPVKMESFKFNLIS